MKTETEIKKGSQWKENARGFIYQIDKIEDTEDFTKMVNISTVNKKFRKRVETFPLYRFLEQFTQIEGQSEDNA